MTRHRAIELMLAQYGNPAAVGEAGGPATPCRAMVQVLGKKNKVFPDSSYLEAGCFDNNHFLYIGPPELRLDQMKKPEVTTDNRRFSVQRAQLMEIGGEPLYLWAILQEKPKGEENGII